MSCSWTGMSIWARTGTECTRIRIRFGSASSHAGDVALAMGLASHDERRHLQRLLTDVDDVVRGDLVRRDVDLLAVDQEVAVGHQLARVAASPGEAGVAALCCRMANCIGKP